MAEAKNQDDIRLAYSAAGGRLFRNHRGKIQDKRTDTWHEFGLAPGASDLIGWTPVVVTPEMVGQTVAVFTAIEVKRDAAAARRKNKLTGQQRSFCNQVRAAGGLALFAWTVRQALELLKQRRF